MYLNLLKICRKYRRPTLFGGHDVEVAQGHLIQWARWARAPNLQGAPRAAEVVIFFLAIM